MKWIGMPLTLLLGLAGCVTPPAEPIAPSRPTVAPVAPVRAEQVTEQTAHKLSQALAEELDHEAQAEIAAPPPTKR